MASPNTLPIFLDGLKFTERQWQVARAIGLGRTTKEIAGDLHRSPKTVEYHRKVIYFILGISTPVELAHWLLRRNLIPFLDL
jgi:DNA-binding NarL/FixJ family response regulator